MNKVALNKYETKIVHKGDWLIFKSVHFRVKDKDCVWEMVERPQKENQIQAGVDVIPIVKRKGKKDQILIIASFRIPLQQYILEFPAGLLDDNNITENALRELKEETGYTAQNIIPYRDMYQVAYSDPWKSTEKGYHIIVTIDGDDPKNQMPQQDLEAEEDIKVLFVDLDENIIESLALIAKENTYQIQAQLWSFAIGYSFNKIVQQQ